MAQDWTNFYITSAGASAALAGLVMVSISVNIQNILKHSHLPAYAAATISTLVLVLASSMAVLINQPLNILGDEILVFAIGCWLLQILFAGKTLEVGLKKQRPIREAILHTTLGQVQTLPFMVGSILLVTSHANGLYWVSGGVIAIFIFSILHAWVLLVEILR